MVQSAQFCKSCKYCRNSQNIISNPSVFSSQAYIKRVAAAFTLCQTAILFYYMVSLVRKSNSLPELVKFCGKMDSTSQKSLVLICTFSSFLTRNLKREKSVSSLILNVPCGIVILIVIDMTCGLSFLFLCLLKSIQWKFSNVKVTSIICLKCLLCRSLKLFDPVKQQVDM